MGKGSNLKEATGGNSFGVFQVFSVLAVALVRRICDCVKMCGLVH